MKQYKIRVTARAEPFWGCWSSYLLIFRDNWSLNPSIHIHVDLHAHTRFAVDKVAGSEPEGLHCSAQPPCCWVECRFHRLTLMFAVVQGKHGCFGDSHRGRLKFQTTASIKTWCGTEQGAISGFWISGSMGEPKDNECLTESSSETITVKIHSGSPLDVSDLQPHCREDVIYDIRCVFDS